MSTYLNKFLYLIVDGHAYLPIRNALAKFAATEALDTFIPLFYSCTLLQRVSSLMVLSYQHVRYAQLSALRRSVGNLP